MHIWCAQATGRRRSNYMRKKVRRRNECQHEIKCIVQYFAKQPKNLLKQLVQSYSKCTYIKFKCMNKSMCYIKGLHTETHTQWHICTFTITQEARFKWFYLLLILQFIHVCASTCVIIIEDGIFVICFWFLSSLSFLFFFLLCSFRLNIFAKCESKDKNAKY